ncbi:hypothetical protein CHU92_06845 [Flavobacterium cyanobacteriorum]|uniref:DUF3570 domain-containing protein n=1 Tax=Flavobacterium cyanobacteriorum TaxID=2022802 RepID=A0A255Z9H1_9FLAO|nr:DUF3570 domain-containing protein [Flavobacterium cyanobacteriorum]OYQ38061.1 hypothetical protein CHU92_06845 [Flavobacterium cyanobacteriorum]
MKRIFITGLALLGLMKAYAQAEKEQDSTAYKNRKLKIEEIDLVSSYYRQNGNNAVVTGGIGSEKLTDISNIIDLNLVKYGENGIKHNYNIEVGVDHYTSASSDRVDLQANSSASSSDTRFYPSLNYIRENEQKGTTLGVGLSSSTEYDYQSFGGNISYAKKTNDRNGEFTARLNVFLDQVKMVAPIELRNDPDTKASGNSARNTFAGSLSYSQVINADFQLLFQADIVSQQGYLALPFHRVYFTDGSVHQEKLPDSRLKIPLAIRGSYFLGDNIIIRGYYRFYSDDWGITSHTANIEIPIKLSPFFSVSPFYRYYNQTAARYFDAFQSHNALDEFYTSNYDLSKFNSNFIGMGIHITPINGIFGIKELAMLEIRYGHYIRSTNLDSDIISINLKFK